MTAPFSKNHRRLAAVSLAFLAGGVAQAQPEYEIRIVEALSTFGIPEAYLWDVNDSGKAVGRMTYTTVLPNGSTSTSYKGFEWTDVAGPIVHTNLGSLDALNNPGDLVAGPTIMWAGGGTSVVQALPGYPTVWADEISDRGMFVGNSHYRSTSNASFDRAIYWTAATGTVDIANFVPSAQFCRDVNNAGQIVGIASFTGNRGDQEAFLFDSVTGVHVPLHDMLTSGGPGTTRAAAINESGVVAGEGWNGSFASAWTWDPALGFTFLPALKQGDRDRNRPEDINARGAVVGNAATDGFAARHAYIWDSNRGMRDLNDLVDAPNGFILDRALKISDTGIIVGDGHFGPGFGLGVAYVLLPIESCMADCDQSTGAGVLDIFDFLCFQDLFVAGDPYACDCDTSTGPLVCDIFDFLCFQNAFVAGCP
jgi:probable HAF family extracellular repeat protein